MTRRVVIEMDCDVCEVNGKRQAGQTFVVQVSGPLDDGEPDDTGPRELELCEEHSTRLLGHLLTTLQAIPVKRPELSRPKPKAQVHRKSPVDPEAVDEGPGYLVKTAALRVGVTQTTIDSYVRKGVLKVHKGQKPRRITQASLDAFAQSRKDLED